MPQINITQNEQMINIVCKRVEQKLGNTTGTHLKQSQKQTSHNTAREKLPPTMMSSKTVKGGQQIQYGVNKSKELFLKTITKISVHMV